ncbi:hypothetical protein [Fictibacillus terranigra]|uniref:Uncharacterized protein n=1 Tax=Fictibacillus terranigra TaxID=3058424 RepID=A0ABT8E2I1_9BACL|nr:hypothetical protein [Fictibacillus sp. CENA-BCM004]MDN4072112.1 hypothetical protein [Fictibacillus sp. CENA-BCM004]
MFSTQKAIKSFFSFLTILMLAGIIFGALGDSSADYSAWERLLAAVVGSLFVVLINYLLYKLLLFLKK